MAEYNVVKYCRICKKRFVVKRTESKRIHCESCQKKYDNGLFDSKEE